MQQEQNNGPDPCDIFIDKNTQVLFDYPAIKGKLYNLLNPLPNDVVNNCDISYEENFASKKFTLSYNNNIVSIDLESNKDYDRCKSFFKDFYNNIIDNDGNNKKCIKKMIAIICSLML